MNNYSKIANMFSGIDSKKLEEAVKKAEILAKNPEIYNAFSKADTKKLMSLISNMNPQDKNKLLAELMNPENAELLKIIKNNL